MFGMAAQPISNEVVHGLRIAALDAIWKSGKRSAQEIVFGLLAPRRADPLAVSVFEPRRLLRGCLSTGQVTGMEFDHLMLGSRDVVGPVAALRGSLRRAGCTLLMGPRLRDPLGNVLAVRAPSYHVRWFLYEALADTSVSIMQASPPLPASRRRRQGLMLPSHSDS